MKRKGLLASLAIFSLLSLAIFSCKKEEPTPAPTVDFSFSVDGYQVAFTALATNTDTYVWDFGDGESSTEQNPVHTYAQSGTYSVTLTVTGKGGTANTSKDVEIAASKLEMLTGGPSATNGKSWQFSSTAGEGDAVLYAVEDLSDPNAVDQAIPSGMLGLIGLPASEYQDEFIFKNDGSYSHTTVNDSVITNAVYAMLNSIDFVASPGEDGVGLSKWTPVQNATFTFTENTDLSLEVTSDDYPDSTWNVTWSGVDLFEIAGGEVFGILDFTRKYMVFDIAADHMQVGMFSSFTTGQKANYPSHILRMTFAPKQ